MKKKAVVIYSGGMDSRTVLAKAQFMDREVHALSMYYGQRHNKELEYAKKVCAELNIPHKLIDLEFMMDLASHSSLTNSNIAVPEGHYEDETMKDTVVPNRNMIFIALATSYAINISADEVWYGAHSGDHAIYPDCRPDFIYKMQAVLNTCHYNPIKLVVPYEDGTKKDILKEGFVMGVDYADTWTCYNGRAQACGKCGSCQERLEAFEQLGMSDPLEYEHE